MTYNASCHCRAVRFRFRSEAITGGVRCNCSICVRRGVVGSTKYLPFEELNGRDALTLYQWGDRECNFWFCKICGINVFHEATENPGHYRINLGCVEGVEVLSLPIEIIDGRAFPLTT